MLTHEDSIPIQEIIEDHQDSESAVDTVILMAFLSERVSDE